jgi:hypothetical protein
MAQGVQAEFLSVALARRELEREVTRLARIEKALFQRDQQSIGNADADEAGGAYCVFGLDDGDSFRRGRYLVTHA